MRKIYLEIDGTRTGLNNENGLFFTDLAGFGAKFNSKYSEISDGFYYNTDNKQAQGSIVGTLNIMSNAYAKYKTFADSIMTASKLVLVYDPLGNGTEYKADCHISYMTKSESVCGVYMAIPIAFSLDSLWYQDSSLIGTGAITVPAGGQIGTAVKVTTVGLARTGFTMTMTDSDGIEFVNVTLSGISIDMQDSIVYSNFYDNNYIVKKDSLNVETDLIPNASLAHPIYEHSRKAFTIAIDAAGGMTGVIVRKYWRTV